MTETTETENGRQMLAHERPFINRDGRKVVIYHGPSCRDGFTAAWAVNQAEVQAVIDGEYGREVEYYPVQAGEGLPEDLDLDGDEPVDVAVLDLCFDHVALVELAVRSRSLVVLDHHKTAPHKMWRAGEDLGLKVTGGTPDGHSHMLMRDERRHFVFDPSHSGAVLAWNHFCPGTEIPELALYVQDRDLWEWKLESSQKINAALRSREMTFENWNRFADALDSGQEKRALIAEGEAIERHVQQKVKSLCEHARPQVIDGHEVPAVQSPLYQSEIGHELLRQHPGAPFVAIYFEAEGGRTIYSLRSRVGVDVSDIAGQFGGGGHAQAAGFSYDGVPLWVREVFTSHGYNRLPCDWAAALYERDGLAVEVVPQQGKMRFLIRILHGQSYCSTYLHFFAHDAEDLEVLLTATVEVVREDGLLGAGECEADPNDPSD